MQLLVNGLIAGSLAALIAGGLALLYGILRVFNLALGQTVLIGGYVTWWLLTQAGAPLVLSVLGGVGAGALLSILTFDIFMKPFYGRHVYLPLVTTIALSMILDGLILLAFGERTRSIDTAFGRALEWGAMRITGEQIGIVAVTIVLLACFAYMLHHTAFGRRIRAVAQQAAAAAALGIPSVALHRVIVILCGSLAALGGIFIGIDQSLTPTLGFTITIKAYAAVIAGGMGNVWGAIACAYLIALLEQLVVGVHWFGLFYVPAGYQMTVPLLFIIVILLLRPQGMFVKMKRAA